MSHMLPRVLSGVAKAAITLLLLWLLFRKIDYAATLQHLRDITALTTAAGLLLLYAALALGTIRWQIVLRSIGRRFTGWSLFRLNLIGLFFNQALPSVIGGDGMRVWLLYQHGCSFSESFNSVLIDRVAGFFFLGLLSLYGLPTIVERLFGVPQLATIGSIIVAIVILLGLLYAFTRAASRLAKFRLGRFATQLVADALFLAARPADATKIALLSIGGQVCNFALIWLILRSLGADVSAVGVMIVAPVLLLLLVLPISIAGWGLREGLFVIGFALLNVPKDMALAASIVFGLMNLLAGLFGGAFWLAEPARARRAMTKPQMIVEPELAERSTKCA
jgi:hypothetical protein